MAAVGSPIPPAPATPGHPEWMRPEVIANQAHTIAELERRRTLALRTATAQRSLLVDGLHALQHGSPHVTEEYLERAIDALAALATAMADPTGR